MTGLVGVPAGISTLSSAPGALTGVQLAESCQLLENEPFQVLIPGDRKVDVLPMQYAKNDQFNVGHLFMVIVFFVWKTRCQHR